MSQAAFILAAACFRAPLRFGQLFLRAGQCQLALGELEHGMALIVPTNLERRVANMRRNYAEGRLVQVMAVFERPA